MTKMRTLARAAGGASLAAAFALAGASGAAQARPSVWVNTPGFSLYAGPGYGGYYGGPYGGYGGGYQPYYGPTYPYAAYGPYYGGGYGYHGYHGYRGSRYDGLYRRNWKNRAFSGE